MKRMIIQKKEFVADARDRSWSVAAEVEMPSDCTEEVLLAHGSRFGGFCFFVRNHRLVFVFNLIGPERIILISFATVPVGRSTLRFSFTRPVDQIGASGACALFINDNKVSERRIAL